MKLAPTLYIVTTETVHSQHGHVYLYEPTVRYATTTLWLARLINWWLGGFITYDYQCLQEHNTQVEHLLNDDPYAKQ